MRIILGALAGVFLWAGFASAQSERETLIPSLPTSLRHRPPLELL